MKRVILAVFLFLLPTVAMAETVSWTLPTQYTDNSAISAADRASIVVGIYANGTKFVTVTPGATAWTGTLPLARGVAGTYTLTATLNGQESAQSAGISYTVPFLAPKPPGAPSVSP